MSRKFGITLAALLACIAVAIAAARVFPPVATAFRRLKAHFPQHIPESRKTILRGVTRHGSSTIAASDLTSTTTTDMTANQLDVADQILHGPRPPELDELGVWRAIERLASRTKAVLTLPDSRPALNADTELAIYQIISDATTNIRNHAPHATLSVTFGFAPGLVHLAVRNSLPPGSSVEAPINTSDAIGLASMLALAEDLGGTATLRATDIEWLIQVTLPAL